MLLADVDLMPDCSHAVTMRILFLTQWFEPEPAFKGATFANALKARGHDVEVATAFPNYPGGKLYRGYKVRPYQRDLVDGLTVHRLAIWPSHNASSLGRIANYVSFFLSTLLFGLLRAYKYDLVYVYHPPITPSVAAGIFCSLYRKPLVVEIQDLWPDSVAASGMVGKTIPRVLNSVCNFVYNRASQIIPQSDRMLERIAERGVPRSKLTRLYNWATYEDGDTPIPESTRLAFAGKFNVVYGGNMGQAQALSDLVEATVIAAKTRPEVHLHLFGNGIERDLVMAEAARLGPNHVTLHPSVDRRTMDRVFDQADVLIAQLNADPLYEITIPSKVQHYLAVGKPIIAGLRGEAAHVLDQSGAAIVCPPQDIEAMAQAILELASLPAEDRRLMGSYGRRFYDATFGFERAIDETLAVIAKATSNPHREQA